MDISKAEGRPQGRKVSYDEAPASRSTRREEHLRRTSAPLSDDLRNHYEDLKEKHRVLRHQYQVLQGSKEKAMEDARMAQEQSTMLWKKLEELKRERVEIQKKLDQKQKGQLFRSEQEGMAKRLEAMCAQNRMLQQDNEQRVVQVEAKYYEQLRSAKLALEETEQDRDSLRFQLSQLKRENERLNEKLACIGPNMESSKREIDKIIDKRDQLRSRVSELRKENVTLQEHLTTANKALESGAKAADASQSRRLSGQLQDELRRLREEKDQLGDENNDLRGKVETSENHLRELEDECHMLRQAMAERDPSPGRMGMVRMGGRPPLMHGGSEEMLVIKRQRSSLHKGRLSQGSTDDDSSDHQQSFTDLAALTISDSGHLPPAQQGEIRLRSSSIDSKKELSSSASNLTALGLPERSSTHSHLGEVARKLRAQLSRCERSLEEANREKQSTAKQLAKVEQERMDVSSQLHSVERELESTKQELTKTQVQLKSAQGQIEAVMKAKGVAMKDNAMSYQQSIQQETRLRELQAEKELLEQKRDIANKEREKMIVEVVALRRKLDTIKTQRQKDAKDLSAMRHLKDKAVQSMEKLRSDVEKLERSKKNVEEELTRMRDSITQASLKSGIASQRVKGSTASGGVSMATTGGGSTSQELQAVLDRLRVVENERKVVCKRLFGAEGGGEGNHSLSEIVHKVDALAQERDDLLVEINALQESSTKLNEDTIFELKQRIEDLLMERDTLSAQIKNLKREVSMLSSKLLKAEQERDNLAMGCERLEMQCQQHKAREARLVEEHTKTLERVNELWRQKWPYTWDEMWEEKNIQVPIGSDGFAGFSIVGGRDQPQMPNPAAFIITTVNANGPADGLLKAGDILESVNGISLACADHRDAVRVVKESKGLLNIVLRRRRNVNPILMGVVSPINATPTLEPTMPEKTEQHDFSLYVTNKENLGFRYEWMVTWTVSEVPSSGPANQILHVGDKLLKVNNVPIAHEKPSSVKKLMKPHKNILKVLIERPKKNGESSCTGEALPSNPADWTPTPDRSERFMEHRPWGPPATTSTAPTSKSSSGKSGYHSDEDDVTHQTQSSRGSHSDIGPKPERLQSAEPSTYRDVDDLSQYNPRSRDSYSSSRDGYSQDCTASQDSGNRPMKLVSVVTAVKKDPSGKSSPPQRPMSDGVVYGNYNERRIEYEEILQSERTESQYSQTESYLSDSSYDGYGLSSSQSIDLTFHSLSTMPQCHPLTVDTVMTTQFEGRSQPGGDEDYGFARDDASRNTFRAQIPGEEGSTSGTSQSQPSGSMDSQLSYTQSSSTDQDHPEQRKGFKRRFLRSHRKANNLHGSRSLTRLTGSTNGYGGMGSRGRSLSNISLGHAPSMTSVQEEPRRSTSTTNLSDKDEHDPLADAIYIRANYTYIPRNHRELSIRTGDVFHIHEEAPRERYRASFWVSRLNEDGTDEQIGAIPNSMRAQEYLEDQGESVEMALYEEVEAFTGRRPVLIFGTLTDQVTATLLETYPNLFFACSTETVEGVARVTEVRLKRETTEGKIIDYWRTDYGFEFIRNDAISTKENKGKHCLLPGSILALQALKSIAPPITIFIKANTEESITTFSPNPISQDQAREIFEEMTLLEEQHGREFSATLLLVYMETLMSQIEGIIHKENRKLAWVPISRQT